MQPLLQLFHVGEEKSTGFKYYVGQREYVEVADKVFFDRPLIEFQCSLA